jgi:hypothetical protein
MKRQTVLNSPHQHQRVKNRIELSTAAILRNIRSNREAGRQSQFVSLYLYACEVIMQKTNPEIYLLEKNGRQCCNCMLRRGMRHTMIKDTTRTPLITRTSQCQQNQACLFNDVTIFFYIFLCLTSRRFIYSHEQCNYYHLSLD